MHLLLDLTIIFSISAVILYLSSRLNIPTVVGLLLSGFLVGPYALGFINETEEVEVLAEIGVLLLLFTIGMEFSLKKLFENKKWILLGGGIQVLGTIFIVAILSRFFGMDYVQAVFMGALFAMSSTAIVLNIFQEKGWMNRSYGKSVLAVLIFQDIAIIPIMLIVPFLVGEQSNAGQAVLQLLIGVAIVTVVLILARKTVPFLLEKIVHAHNQELFLMSILVICFATAFTTYQLGLKLALGAFLAGLIVSESDYSYDAISKILPLKKIFTSIFFISVGMLLNASFLLNNLFIILALVIGVVLLKLLIVVLIGLWLKLSIKDALISGIALSQVGEFAFILSAVGNDYEILNDNQYQIFLGVSILSMVITPFFIVHAPKLADRLLRLRFMRFFAKKFHVPLRKDAKLFRESDHIVVIGFGPAGKQAVKAAKENNLKYAIIELNIHTVDHYLELGEPIYAGNACDPEVLKKAAVEAARTIVISVPSAAAAEKITIEVRKLAPHAQIIVRTNFESEIEILKQLGANEVVPSETEAGRRIAEHLAML